LEGLFAFDKLLGAQTVISGWISRCCGIPVLACFVSVAHSLAHFAEPQISPGAFERFQRQQDSAIEGGRGGGHIPPAEVQNTSEKRALEGLVRGGITHRDAVPGLGGFFHFPGFPDIFRR
jgi:hypothetical protein